MLIAVGALRRVVQITAAPLLGANKPVEAKVCFYLPLHFKRILLTI